MGEHAPFDDAPLAAALQCPSMFGMAWPDGQVSGHSSICCLGSIWQQLALPLQAACLTCLALTGPHT